MTIEQIQVAQDKLLAIYAQDFVDSHKEHWELLGFESFESYVEYFETIWTPQFRYRLYILQNPEATLEQAFLHGYNAGYVMGDADGYDDAIKDMEDGVPV